MPRLPIAVRLESLRVPVRKGIETAARLGANGVQFDAVGELGPEELTQTGQRHLKHLVTSHAMRIVAIGAPTRHGYDTLEKLDGRVRRTIAALDLASKLGVPVVCNHIGTIPENFAEPVARHFLQALEQIGHAADRVGVRFAIKSGADSPERLAELLVKMNCHGLAVDYDPTNLLVRGFRIYHAVEQLALHIAAVHVRDMVRSAATVTGFREVPMGKGEIEWERLLGTLASVDYHGPVTVDSETTERPIEQIGEAIAFLSAF